MKVIRREYWPNYKEYEEEIGIDDILYSLDSAGSYNGLSRYIQEWKNIPENPYGSYWPIYREQTDNIETQAQLQIFWMIAVEMFGNCGTSPRSGWIEKENLEAFHEFIDRITESQREEDEIDEYCRAETDLSFDDWKSSKK